VWKFVKKKCLYSNRKNGVKALAVLRLAFTDSPFLPDFVAPLP
jgi:hypothetical protein